MRYALLLTTLLAAPWIASHAHAGTVTAVYCGPGSDNSCELSGDAMVFLEKADGVTSGLGNIGKQNASLLMDIVSTGGMLNMFIDLSNGFSTIDPTHPATTFNGLTLSVPGFEITDLTFSAQLTGTTFTATPTAGGSALPANTFTDQSNASQGYGVQAVGGGFDSVTIAALSGFEEIKHIEVGLCVAGATGCTPVVIPTPEPSTLAVFGAGLVGLGLLRFKWKGNAS